MKKKKIVPILIGLMSAALIGIVWIQLYWINTAYKFREREFNFKVMDAMGEVTDVVQAKETLNSLPQGLREKVTEIFREDSINTYKPPTWSSLPRSRRVQRSPKLNTKSINKKIHLLDTLRELEAAKDTSGIFAHAKNIPADDEPAHPRRKRRIEVTDSAFQKGKVSGEVEALNVQRLSNLVQNELVSFSLVGKDLVGQAKKLHVDSIIASCLTKRGIDLPFAYAFLKGKCDSLVPGTHSTMDADTADLRRSRFRVPLIPFFITAVNDYLIIYIPDSQGYVIQSIGIVLPASVILILVIILSFGFTVQTLLKEKKLSRIKDDFVNNMTHEFKTPIATIALATDAINNPRIYGDPVKLQHFTGIIKEENLRMNRQVEKVLQMAMLDKSDLHLMKQDIDMHQLIERAVKHFSLQVQQKQGNIIMDLAAKNYLVNGDETHLNNVINNLLDNANKYSEDKPEIELKSWSDGKYFHFSVSDKGIGMSRDAQKKVFERFYRVTTGNLHDVKGFGLGLSYVKAILDAHDGLVAVDSEPEHGSTFTISVPLKNI